eukprot:CAMPEP_0114418882 /NCGR_PEP_ID=MMETSP0103-20121206/3733_1 /TAXON_ID=37642 ORGANISM="Paraphysomonas imperforata, Strain PA2" /NCGR_SAMPLE_ID=MMETSP0103 /ASSEMBLY_ACC=CAM_ASM_000201 /LENGTH=129 /DNA_ID=CAMNT_0001587269 /DNA_START=45 /DNA_END=434 /DNA_ORIENTATION=+
MSQGAPSGHGLDDFLSKIIDRYPDIKSIVMSSAEGNELISVQKPVGLGDGGNVHKNLVTSFSVSTDQSTRLNLGKVKYAVLWSGRSITLQFKVELVVVSIVLEENANLGVMDEFIPLIQKTMLPFCTAV